MPIQLPIEIAMEKEDSEGYDPEFYDPDEMEFFSEDELAEFNVFEEVGNYPLQLARRCIDHSTN